MNLTVEQATDAGNPVAQERRRWWIACQLWFFLLAFGAHRFYPGRGRTGTIQILGIVCIYRIHSMAHAMWRKAVKLPTVFSRGSAMRR
jgi:TM2 domain-containing membrane protein YozV